MRLLPVAVRVPVVRPPAILLLNFSLLTCMSCDQTRPEPATVRPPDPPIAYLPGSSSPPSRFHLHVGDTLRVQLDASPAAGRAWILQGTLPAVLRMESDPGAFPLVAGKPRLAAQAWTFRAERSGRAVLRFAYRRAWEAPSLAVERRDVEVVVE